MGECKHMTLSEQIPCFQIFITYSILQRRKLYTERQGISPCNLHLELKMKPVSLSSITLKPLKSDFIFFLSMMLLLLFLVVGCVFFSFLFLFFFLHQKTIIGSVELSTNFSLASYLWSSMCILLHWQLRHFSEFAYTFSL